MDAVSGITSSIIDMNNLLKDITSKSMGLEEKMMQQNVIEKVSNTGENLDITV